MSPWVLILTMMNHYAACEVVGGERILAGDLARALPVFSAVPRDVIVGYSPTPGTRRVLQFPELARFGARYQVAVPPDTNACFERKMQHLGEDNVRTAMQETLQTPAARIEILATSGPMVPEGKLMFPITGLTVSTAIDPATPVIWRGYVLYDKSRRFAVWARVRVSATLTRVVALKTLVADAIVHEQDVRLETYDDFPLRRDVARSLDEVIGLVPRRAIRQGAPVLRTDMAEALQVQRGELVTITAISGRAQLQLDGMAESSGRQGDLISVKNPRSGKTFRARVEGKGKAIVVAGVLGSL